jgi:hypothetical protein
MGLDLALAGEKTGSINSDCFYLTYKNYSMLYFHPQRIPLLEKKNEPLF